jgi:hypothetical protein
MNIMNQPGPHLRGHGASVYKIQKNKEFNAGIVDSGRSKAIIWQRQENS